jgi:hypothetical protein
VSGYIESHVHDVSVRKWNLIGLAFDTPLRFATGDFDVVWDGHVWLARLSSGGRPCGVSSIQMQGGVLVSGAIQVPDANHAVFTLLRATNGGEGIAVTIWEAWFDAANASAVPDDVRLRASWKIDSPSKDESGGNDLVEIKLVSAGALNVYVPSRLVTDLTKAA